MSQGFLEPATRGPETAERQKDAFIARQHDKRVKEERGLSVSQDAATAREKLWKASVSRYQEERRLQARLEWHRYHSDQAERMRRTLEELIARHEEQARRLLEESEPKGA